MEWTITNFLLTSLTICLGSILQAATGLGAGLIIVPLLAFISYQLIPGPMIFASLSLTAVMSIVGRKHIDFSHLGKLMSGLISGIIIAVSLISYLPLAKLGLVFGLLIIIAVIISLYSSRVEVTGRWYPLIGAVSGFMGTTAAIGAPVLAMLYQLKSAATIRATLAFIYFVSSIIILLSLHVADRFGLQDLVNGIYLIPGFILGFLISPFFSRWVDQGYARPSVLILSSVSAVLLIIKSL